MQINAGYNLFASFGVRTPTPDGAGAPSPSASSLFGPSALLSLGPTSTSAYGGLFTPASAVANTGVNLPQFDLSAIFNTQASIPQNAVSPAQQKEEQSAIKAAFDLIDSGQYDQARASMNALLERNPTNSAAVHALAYTELSDGNYEDAEQLFLKAHVLNPTVGYDRDAENARILQSDDDTVADRARAMVASPLRREEGIRVLIELTKRSPDHTEGRILLGDAMLDTGDAANGLMQYDAAVRSADTGMLSQIGQRVAEFAEQTPESAFIQRLLGRVYLKQGKYQDALQPLTQAVELADNKTAFEMTLAEAYVGIGRQQLEREDIHGALAAFEKAQELDPTDHEVKSALAEGYVARAEKRARLRDYDSAVDDLYRAEDLLADSSDDALKGRAAHTAYIAGKALQQARIDNGEEIDGEVGAFKLAHHFDGDNATYKRMLGDAYEALGTQQEAAGELREAAFTYQRAHELYPSDDTYETKAFDAFMAWGADARDNLRYDDAVTAFREAYLIDRYDADAKLNLAEAHNTRGLYHKSWERYTDAADDFEEAWHLFPDNADYESNYYSVSAWDDD